MGFKAALFDMDGTLLDSMGVWAQVDEDFFSIRGLVAPDDYGPNLAGKSFMQSAEYTKERFCLPESCEEIVAEWNALCQAQYEHHVALKSGAAEYLRLLKRHGVKIAAATALPEHLFMPALVRNGVADLFDAFTSTEETGTHKRTGDVYMLAAQKLGVAPQDCIVFEDILEGIEGAHKVNMRACAVFDPSHRNRAAIDAAADFRTRDFVSGVPLPESAARWSRAVIVPTWLDGRLPMGELRQGDCIIAADRGCVHCRNAGIVPDFCLGDFDSLEAGEAIPETAIRYPAEKDDTDVALAVKLALSLGLDDIWLLGGIGGRLDHTVANLQLMRYAVSRHASLTIFTGIERARLLLPGTYTIPTGPARRFSLFAFSPCVNGLCIRGAKYPLENAALTDSFPLGVSNETMTGTPVHIAFECGQLLLIEAV